MDTKPVSPPAEPTHALAHTIFIRFGVVFVVVVILIALANLAIGQPWYVTGQLVVTGVVHGGLILLSQQDRWFLLARLLALANLYLMALLQWLLNAGMDGPTELIFLCVALFSLSIFIRGWLWLLLVNGSVYALAILIQLWAPQWITPYSEAGQRLLDHAFAYAIALVYLSLVIITIVAAYHAEQQKSAQMHDLVKQQNRLLQEEKEKFERLSSTDSLTGIANRRRMQQRLDEAAARFARDGVSFSVLLIDIDHFKTINDQYGHQCGDAVLIELVERLQASLRLEDVLARWGGEEFLVLLPRHTAPEGRVAGERLRLAIASAPFFWKTQPLDITISLGIDEMGRGDTVDALLSRADHFLYAAKASGRNRIVGGEAYP